MIRLLPVLALFIGLLNPVPATATPDRSDPVTRPGADAVSRITNSDATGQVSRFDVDGDALDAHDGSLIQVGDTFYLYGTSYACGFEYQRNSDFCGFKVYSSPDLRHWTDRGYVVAPGVCGYCFRPHVVYNAATSLYVLWADAGGRYLVATSPTPTGLFERRPDPVLAVGGAVDMALFVDTDGTGYVIHNTVEVPAGLTADMVVERLTPDYLSTDGRHVRLGLGDVEAFTVFKRDGVYHALMSDPSCAYCAGATGEMTATSMLGPWSGAFYDPDGVHQSGRPQPRYRARLVNADNCGGQPLAALPITDSAGRTTYYFVSDRWNTRVPNQGLANLFVGPMTFGADGTLQDIECTASFSLSLPGPGGSYRSSPDLDQRSGFDGFHHYCDIAGAVTRQQSFVPSRSGYLSSASVTTFQSGRPNAAAVLEVTDAAGRVLGRDEFPPGSVPWAPTSLTARFGIAVTAGQEYRLRLRSATTTGCYGWEYSDSDPYAAGVESYSIDSGTTFTVEPGRDLKFTTDVAATPTLTLPGPPAGSTRCAGEGERCTFEGTRLATYGAGASAGGYRSRVATGGIDCGVVGFGADPLVGTLKSCSVAPAGDPAGFARCAAENGSCSVRGPAVVAFGTGGVFVHRLVRDEAVACTPGAFGRDPLPGVAKSCSVAPSAAPAGSTSCAAETGTCRLPGPRTVGYGARGAFVTRWVTGSSVPCRSEEFGGDPIPDVVKSCYLLGRPN